MTEVLLSFIALAVAVSALVIAGAGIAKLVRGKPWPGAGRIATDCLVSAGATIGITLVISLAFRWTGFSEGFYYRPSDRNFGQHTKLGLSPENCTFQTSDGVRLHGWFLPVSGSPTGTVVHLHGSDRNISYTVRNAYWLTEHGFNVFVFDYRGYGRSEGAPSRRGLVEDAKAAIAYVKSREDVDETAIALWGQSMGGQVGIVTAGTAESKGLTAVVAEATYASHSHQVKDKLAQMGPLWLIQWAVWLTASDAYSALGVVERVSPTRLLLVHGTSDRGVAPYHSRWLYEAADPPKDLWEIEGAGHLEVFHNETHRGKLVAFLHAAVKGSAP